MYIYVSNNIVFMASLKKVIYIIDLLTSGDKDKFVSAREISLYFEDEGKQAFDRVRSELNSCRPYFNIKRVKGRVFYRLSSNGNNYLDIFINTYDPVTDTVIMKPLNIERV